MRPSTCAVSFTVLAACHVLCGWLQAGFSGLAGEIKHSTKTTVCAALEDNANLDAIGAIAEAYDGCTGGSLPHSESAMGVAALAVIVLQAGRELQPQLVPLDFTGLVVVIVLELVFVFGVGTSCVVFSIATIRRLRRYVRVVASQWALPLVA